MKEFDVLNKTMGSIQSLLRSILEQLNKALEILLKDRENLDLKDIKRYEDFQKVLDMFEDHLQGKGILIPVIVEEKDKILIKETCEANEKAFIDSQKGDDKEFVGTFENKHFAFENIPIELSDGRYAILLKDKDISKFAELKNYLDEHHYTNNIELYQKDIENILKIDDSKALMSIDIDFQESYEKIANTLNAYKIPFEVANQEKGIKIIFEKNDSEKVARAINNSGIESDLESANYITNMKAFNNREEAKKAVDEMTNESTKKETDNKEKER